MFKSAVFSAVAFLMLAGHAYGQLTELSYFDQASRVMWRSYPSEQQVKGSTGNDTTIRVHGLVERFTSPFATTYLDSLEFAFALPHYVDLPNNDILVIVSGSVKVPSGG